MLNCLLISVKAVLPMLLLLLTGMAVRRFRLLDANDVVHLNRLLFVVFFPPLMFQNLYGAQLREAVDLKLIGFGCCAAILVYGIAVLLACLLTRDPGQRGAFIQAVYRSNFAIMGMSVAANIYGHGNLAVTAMMVAVIVPLYNVLAVITLEVFRGGRPRAGAVIRKVLTNPLILGAAAGILCIVTGLKLPALIEDLIAQMSRVTTPMALVMLGASISLQSMHKSGKLLRAGVVMRLIAVPAAGLTAAALLGFRGLPFVTLIAMFASPTAISAFTMAQTMDSDGELTGNFVVLSTVFSGLTMFLWIFLFKTLGMF